MYSLVLTVNFNSAWSCKDTFALDKMFFLINAADLAESEEELEMVKGYIADQLLQYGIRNPRLFAISSLCALEEKQGKNVEKEVWYFTKLWDYEV